VPKGGHCRACPFASAAKGRTVLRSPPSAARSSATRGKGTSPPRSLIHIHQQGRYGSMLAHFHCQELRLKRQREDAATLAHSHLPPREGQCCARPLPPRGAPPLEAKGGHCRACSFASAAKGGTVPCSLDSLARRSSSRGKGRPLPRLLVRIRHQGKDDVRSLASISSVIWLSHVSSLSQLS
jgi:hypothetical protein